MSLLEVKSLVKSFGGVMANNDVSFSIEAGETVGLIGPNGAGKTTLFNCVAGYHRPDGGAIIFQGRDITGWPPYNTNRQGIARTFQVTESGGDLSVLEEVMIGAFCRTASRRQATREAQAIVELTGLEQVSRRKIFELPVAQQKRVGLARALATKPVLLMLDEAAAGLTPSEIEQFKALISRIMSTGQITLFLIEHVMALVMGISQRVIVLDGGVKICEGPPEEVADNPDVIKAYLGEKYAASRKS